MTSMPPDGKLTPRGATVNPLPPSVPNGVGADSGGASLEKLPPEILMQIMQQRQLEANKLKWVQWVEQEFQKCKSARTNHENQWYINLAFTLGRQYIAPQAVAGHGFRLTTPKSPPWRVRTVVNKTRAAVITEHAKLTTNKPIPTVIPATNESEDFSAAAVGEQLLKSNFMHDKFNSEYRLWVWWGVVCGTSFMKSWWDPHAKDYEAMMLPPRPNHPETGEPLSDAQMAVLGQNHPEFAKQFETPIPAQGKIQSETITPFHVFVPNLMAESLESQPYLIQAQSRDLTWVKRDYGIDATPDSKSSHTILDTAYLLTKGSEEHLDSVMVYEIWLKPHAHPDFPEGGMMTIINHNIVQLQEKWPCPFPEFPYYKYDGIKTGGFYGDSRVVDLIPLQKEYNRTRSQMTEIKNTMGKPKILYPRGSINPRKISSEPGQSIEYVQGYDQPTVLNGTDVPSTFYNELQTLTQDFDDISGQHEISRGTTPKDVTSGTAIAFLQEQDDTKLSDPVTSIENAIQKYGRHYLKYVITYWDSERIIKITGKNQTVEALIWKKGELRGNTDVRVQTGSALPYSKAARNAQITEWMQNGFILPEVGLEMIDTGLSEKAMEDFLIDKRQASRENLKMSQAPDGMVEMLMKPHPGPNGEPPYEAVNPETGKPMQINGDNTPFQPQPIVPVNSWDNHEAHIQWHNHYRKSQEFENLSEAKKKAFELHVQLHQIALSSSMTNAFGMAIPNPGADEMNAEKEAAAQEQAGQQEDKEFERGKAEQEGQFKEKELELKAQKNSSGN
jgi:hypothetical protein